MAHFQSEAEFQEWLKTRSGGTYTGTGDNKTCPLKINTLGEAYVDTPLPKPHQPLERKIPKTERAYMQYLDRLQRSGEIVRYWHEPFRFILVHNVPGGINSMTYDPDFLVQFPGHLRVVEIKGSKKAEYDDAKDKFKMACQMFPCFEFVKVYVNTKTGEMKEEKGS